MPDECVVRAVDDAAYSPKRNELARE